MRGRPSGAVGKAAINLALELGPMRGRREADNPWCAHRLERSRDRLVNQALIGRPEVSGIPLVERRARVDEAEQQSERSRRASVPCRTPRHVAALPQDPQDKLRELSAVVAREGLVDDQIRQSVPQGCVAWRDNRRHCHFCVIRDVRASAASALRGIR